jgi:hypothetical protein
MFAEPTLKTLDFLSGTISASSRITMNQWREDMKKRAHAFAVDVVRLVQEIPDRSDTRRLKDQLARRMRKAGRQKGRRQERKAGE